MQTLQWSCCLVWRLVIPSPQNQRGPLNQRGLVNQTSVGKDLLAERDQPAIRMMMMMNMTRNPRAVRILCIEIDINNFLCFWHYSHDWVVSKTPFLLTCLQHCFHTIYAKDAREKNQVKAKLRRLCEEKSNGRLKVPQWLHDEWKNSDDRLAMARKFEACGYDKDILLRKIRCLNPAPLTLISIPGHSHIQ